MNANENIFALALASNHLPEQHFAQAYRVIQSWGEVQFSDVYLIPCRDGVGQDYWNSACLLISNKTSAEIEVELKHLEAQAGRIRPSHQISLDIDLIAWGKQLDQMQFNPKKMPLALDVKIPLSTLWQNPALAVEVCNFPVVDFKTDHFYVSTH